MIKRVQSRAFANIALCKYWGKIPGPGNLPATSSISLALDKLMTVTVATALSKGPDKFYIDEKQVDPQSRARLTAYLDVWRRHKYLEGYYKIESVNSFPTASGLASSASGYAALTTALSGFAAKSICTKGLTRLSRMGSGSSARSITGGLSKIAKAKNPCSELILPPEKIPWGMVVAIVDSGKKEIGSMRGMELSRRNSPYFDDWLKQSAKDYRAMLRAVVNMDFTSVGEICEANALAMHACMIATRPALVYWSDATVILIRTAERLRRKGLENYCTIDAGPHVAFLARREDLPRLRRRISKVFGVKKALECYPAGDANILDIEYD